MANDWPGAWAIRAVKDGLSANAGFRAAQAAGFGGRRATFLRLYAEARANLSGHLDEATKNLDARPYAQDIFPMETRHQTGYLQHGGLFTRNRDTGDVTFHYRTVATDVLMTRRDVLATIEENGRRETRTNGTLDGEIVIGSTYLGTYLMYTPGEAA
jgi:hypothetical protein